MNKKRICVMTSVHPVFDTRIFYKQCRSLAKNGYEVILIAKHQKEEIIDNIRIVPFPKFKNKFMRMMTSPIRMFILAKKQEADVYHFHDPELMLSGILLKCFGNKVIYDVHEDYKKVIVSTYYVPKCVKRFAGWLINFIEKFSSLFFDAIISATEDIKRNFQGHRRSIVVANYPLMSSLNTIENDQQRKEKKNFIVIYSGSLAPKRGLIQVVRAMELIKDFDEIRLVLCGTCSPSSFEKIIKNMKGFEKVDYLGFINYKLLWRYYKQADVGIVNFLPDPNHINAMPNKLFEYMASGLPVISSNFPLWKEVVEGNQCGITVDPLIPEEIAKAIIYLHNNPQLREKMGKNGRQSVKKKYNWDIENKKLLQVYEEL